MSPNKPKECSFAFIETAFTEILHTSRLRSRKYFREDETKSSVLRENILIEVIIYPHNESAQNVLANIFLYVLDMYDFDAISIESLEEITQNRRVVEKLCDSLASCDWLSAFWEIHREYEVGRALGENFLSRKDDEDEDESRYKVIGGGTRPVKGPNIKMTVELSSGEYLQGCSKEILVRRRVKCPDCKGFSTSARRRKDVKAERCKTCNGQLRILVEEPYLISFPKEVTSPYSFVFWTGKCLRNKELIVKDLGDDGINGGECGDLTIRVEAEVDYSEYDPSYGNQWSDFDSFFS
jgi:hypothetical protein